VSDAPELRIVVPARAGNVAVLRRAISGLAEALGFERTDADDLQTIVTEAAMNVVQHAYDEEEGPLELTASRRGDGLDVSILDQGNGFRPRPADPGRGELRLGLPLIAALSDGFEIKGGPGRGTEVRIRKLLASGSREPGEGEQAAVEAPEATALSVEADAPTAAVLSPVIGMLATRADLSIDRLADSQLLGDVVSATPAREFTDGRIDIEVSDRDGRLQIRVGPLVPGAPERLLKGMELPGPLVGSLRALASEIRVESAGEAGERLLIEVDDPR
jgi:anti-sigma regulatory factor (Ser/Thr protein kinase)